MTHLLTLLSRWGIILLLLVGLILLLQLPVRTVTCQLPASDCPENIQVVLSQLEGKKLFLSDADSEVLERLSAFPSYKLSHIQRRFPGEMLINLEVIAPAYYIQARDTGELRLIDAAGNRISSDQQLILPLARVGTFSDSSDVVEPWLHSWIMAVTTVLQNNQVEFQLVDIISETTLAVELNETQVGVISREQPQLEAERLSIVLKGLDPDKLGETQEIDARFALPVLRTARTIPRQNSI